MVYGEVKSFREKVPLTILSGGMNKLAAILVVIPDGTQLRCAYRRD